MESPKLVKVYSTNSESDIAFIKSLLDTTDIYYAVFNDNLGSRARNVFISSMDVMVAEDRLEEAKELLKDFVKD